MHFSQNVEKLKPSATIAVSTLAKKLAAEGRDIINLSAGEPDFDTPGFISEAAVQGIRDGRTRYTPPAGVPELRAAIARHLSEQAGRPLPSEGVVVSAGAKQALFNAIFALFGPGDEVLIATPYWTTYPDLVTIARAHPVPVSGPQEGGFKVTPAQLDEAATASTRGLIVNTPSNPTGAVYTRDELAAIARWCRERGVWLISDEIYRYIHHDGDEPAPGILDLDEADLGPFVIIDGASKSFAMTGWRIGFSFTDPEVAGKVTALQSQVTSNAATPSQVAALAAYSDRAAAQRSLREMGDAFRRRRDLVVQRLEELLPGVPYVRPGGAFYLFFRVDAFFDDEIRDATAWCSALLEREGVALVPGAAFGDDRWVRLSFATADEILEEAFRRIASMAGVATPG
jgi:aspartate aminotransferase